MKYLFSGDDTLALRFHKQELVQSFLDQHPEGKVFSFDFTDVATASLGTLQEELTPDLFSTPKLVVVEGLSTLYQDAQKQVEALISQPLSFDIIFLENRKIPKSDAFFKIAKPHIQKEEQYDVKKRDVRKLIAALQEQSGCTLDERTIDRIRERAGKDDELALQNIQKVLTFSQGKTVSEAELDILVPAPLEAKVFDALDALVNGKREEAFAIFHRILTEEDIFRILPLCAWQIRQMLLITAAKERLGENKAAIASDTGIHPFVVQKLLRVLPHFSRARLARGLRLLAELDVDLKLSRKTPGGALQYFVFHW